MKKIMILLSMATICMSCAKEMNPAGNEGQTPSASGAREFIATMENVGTKTTLDADLNVKWSKGDIISVFDETGKNFKFETQNTGSSVVFTQVTEGEMVGSTFYAVFPYNESATLSGNVISTKMNTANYTASPGDFSKSWHNIMTAKSSGNELKFKNLASLVKFEIPEGLDLASFYFSATNVIAATVDVAVGDDGVPSVSSRSTESYGTTISPREGNTLAPGVYYMPILPGTYKNFRLALTWASGSVTQSDAFSLDSFEADRNKVVNIGTLYDNREYYRWITFENQKMHSAIAYWQGQEVAGLNNFTIIENPWKYKANPSQYVVKMDASSFNSPHGGFNIDISAVNNSVKGRITAVKFQMFVTSVNAQKYYPRLESGTNKFLPSSINGKKPSAAAWTKEEFNNAMNTDGWNEFTFPIDATSLSLLKIRPMLWFSSGAAVDSNTGDRIVYFDNIGFSFVGE
jgi:hypothetical protein